MDIYAHSLTDTADRSGWEPLAHHLQAVGKTAAGFADCFGASRLALAAGLLHDIGKCSTQFQRYIAGEENTGGDHSTAGAREAVCRYGLYGKLIAYAIAGHHSGLMDGAGHEGGTLSRRLDTNYPLNPYPEWEQHAVGLPTASEISLAPLKNNGIGQGFQLAFFIRMLFSCLVDADFLETERFYASARGEVVDRGGDIDVRHLERLRDHMAAKRRDDTELNRLRAEILDHVVAQAAQAPGLFTLTVPTGGGKTLASLNFALDHALRHGMKRVIYVIPFTSIIEQTAQVFRAALGDDAHHDILEHHASFDWDAAAQTAADDEGPAGLAKLRRAAENWDAPIIVTTAVQFFESLFAARTSKSRKLHNIANSVVILDEAQTLPVHLLRPCMAALEELANNYRTSVVLCTATQPALRQCDNALPLVANKTLGFNIDDRRELAPDPRRLYANLKRVAVEWQRDPMPDSAIADRFATVPQMLCIVNSRAHAHALHGMIHHLPGARHLTTLMCAAHRRQVLAAIREDLAARRPVRLVATSLIEAGVDVDFPEVWRAAAGLDSIAQAAGRCNREGRLEGGLGRVVVFEPVDHGVPRALKTFWEAARPVLDRHTEVLGLDAVRDYFRQLYFLKGPVALDRATLDGRDFAIIEAIAKASAQGATMMDYPFARIASAFRLIDETMAPVIVPWQVDAGDDRAARALTILAQAERPPRNVLRTLQQYVVPVPDKARMALVAAGAAQAVAPDRYGDRFIVLASSGMYDDAIGLRLADPTFRTAEENII